MDTLKALNFIPPLVALGVVGWFSSQRRTISFLEEETTVLRKQMAASHSSAKRENPSGRPPAPAKSAKDKQHIDLKQMASQMDEILRGGGRGDMRAMMRFQKQLMTMSRDELAAALVEIGAMDLPASKAMLEGMLIGPLVQKDPQFALAAFADRLNDDEMSWQLANALGEWAKKDIGAATVWMDQQVAGGKFESKSLDGKNGGRMQFESTLIATLLGSDSAAASARLGALPADQRAEVVSNYPMNSVKEEDQLAWADMIRTQVPEKAQSQTLAQTASRLAGDEDGYEKVSSYLERIKATPEERTASVQRTADTRIQVLSRNSKITRDTIDAMREWAASEAPGSAYSVTGRTLARATQMNGQLEFTDAAELAVQYHDASGNDEVLIGFLEKSPSERNKETARELAAKITDENRRNEFLQRFK